MFSYGVPTLDFGTVTPLSAVWEILKSLYEIWYLVKDECEKALQLVLYNEFQSWHSYKYLLIYIFSLYWEWIIKRSFFTFLVVLLFNHRKAMACNLAPLAIEVNMTPDLILWISLPCLQISGQNLMYENYSKRK